MTAQRLQKVIAQAGLTSRRGAERLIVDGRVRVNGEVVRELGKKADPLCDRIEVDSYGRLQKERSVYVMLHKPEKVVCTVHDPEGRPTVIDVVERSSPHGSRSSQMDLPRLFPVGRLDFDAAGLVLLTNDGELAQLLTHPRFHVGKTYLVKVRGRPDGEALKQLRQGVHLRREDGSLERRKTAPAAAVVRSAGPSNSWIELTLHEGRNHQVKRMCEAIGHRPIRLLRISVAGLRLGELPPGAWRFLTKAEVALLKKKQSPAKSARGLTPFAHARKNHGHER
jgi:23S rRNA pseudouridine2605 synthase